MAIRAWTNTPVPMREGKLELSHRRRPVRGDGPLKLMLMLQAAAGPRAPSTPRLSRSEGLGSGRFVLQLSFLPGRGGPAERIPGTPSPSISLRPSAGCPFPMLSTLPRHGAGAGGGESGCPLVSTLPVSSGSKGQAGKGARCFLSRSTHCC